MQFSLRTLFILTAIVCVYCGILNAPVFIAFPLFCALVWLTPAYWIAGVIYAREARRAFFIGGLAAGAVPFVALVFCSLVMAVDGPWRWSRSYGRYEFGETQLINMIASLFIFAPVALAFLGGWISLFVYHSLQPPRPVPPPVSPFGPVFPPPKTMPSHEGEQRPEGTSSPSA